LKKRTNDPVMQNTIVEKQRQIVNTLLYGPPGQEGFFVDKVTNRYFTYVVEEWKKLGFMFPDLNLVEETSKQLRQALERSCTEQKNGERNRHFERVLAAYGIAPSSP